MANNTHADDRDMYIEISVDEYIKTHDLKIVDLIDDKSTSARDMRVEIIAQINEKIALANALRAKGDKLRNVSSLPGYAVAQLLIATGDVKRLTLGTSGYDIIAKRYYKNAKTTYTWKWAGTYEIINVNNYDNAVMRALSLLIPDANAHDETTLIRYLACHAESVSLNNDNQLVFFRNGVWDYRTKTLTAYSDPAFDQKYRDTISLAKLPVYHPLGAGAVLAPNALGHLPEPTITNPDGTMWKPSSCFEDPFDMTDEVGRASNTIMWELLHFLIRHMNGQPHLYHFWVDAGGKGHNGKSTLWEIMQRLIFKELEAGDEDLKTSGRTVIDCAIEDLEKDYVVAQNIKTAYAIVGQESKAATSYIENCAMIKMLAREQEYTFRQIRQEPFSFKFRGALIQQINKAPMFAEKTDSMFTHSVNVPFVNSFDESRHYIKDDYILREEVAEWLAYRVTVEMEPLTAYSTWALKTLEPFKREMLCETMNTMQALDEIVPGLYMNFIPAELLYDLYIRWCDKNGVNGRSVVSFKVFRDDLEQYGINNNDSVEYTKKYARTSTTDLDHDHPAMKAYAYSNRNYMSTYARQTNIDTVMNYKGALNPNQFSDNGKTKVWTKGGLRRLVKWQDMVKDSDVIVEIDEDNNI